MNSPMKLLLCITAVLLLVGTVDATANITNLSGTSTCNSAVWTFTKPTSADYGGVMTWKNNEWQGNVSGNETTFSWSNLSANATYLLSTKTCSSTGACNQFINATITTKAFSCSVYGMTYYEPEDIPVGEGAAVAGAVGGAVAAIRKKRKDKPKEKRESEEGSKFIEENFR